MELPVVSAGACSVGHHCDNPLSTLSSVVAAAEEVQLLLASEQSASDSGERDVAAKECAMPPSSAVARAQNSSTSLEACAVSKYVQAGSEEKGGISSVNPCMDAGAGLAKGTKGANGNGVENTSETPMTPSEIRTLPLSGSTTPDVESTSNVPVVPTTLQQEPLENTKTKVHAIARRDERNCSSGRPTNGTSELFPTNSVADSMSVLVDSALATNSASSVVPSFFSDVSPGPARTSVPSTSSSCSEMNTDDEGGDGGAISNVSRSGGFSTHNSSRNGNLTPSPPCSVDVPCSAQRDGTKPRKVAQEQGMEQVKAKKTVPPPAPPPTPSSSSYLYTAAGNGLPPGKQQLPPKKRLLLYAKLLSCSSSLSPTSQNEQSSKENVLPSLSSLSLSDKKDLCNDGGAPSPPPPLPYVPLTSGSSFDKGDSCTSVAMSSEMCHESTAEDVTQHAADLKDSPSCQRPQHEQPSYKSESLPRICSTLPSDEASAAVADVAQVMASLCDVIPRSNKAAGCDDTASARGGTCSPCPQQHRSLPTWNLRSDGTYGVTRGCAQIPPPPLSEGTEPPSSLSTETSAADANPTDFCRKRVLTSGDGNEGLFYDLASALTFLQTNSNLVRDKKFHHHGICGDIGSPGGRLGLTSSTSKSNGGPGSMSGNPFARRQCQSTTTRGRTCAYVAAVEVCYRVRPRSVVSTEKNHMQGRDSWIQGDAPGENMNTACCYYCNLHTLQHLRRWMTNHKSNKSSTGTNAHGLASSAVPCSDRNEQDIHYVYFLDYWSLKGDHGTNPGRSGSRTVVTNAVSSGFNHPVPPMPVLCSLPPLSQQMSLSDQQNIQRPSSAHHPVRAITSSFTASSSCPSTPLSSSTPLVTSITSSIPLTENHGGRRATIGPGCVGGMPGAAAPFVHNQFERNFSNAPLAEPPLTPPPLKKRKIHTVAASLPNAPVLCPAPSGECQTGATDSSEVVMSSETQILAQAVASNEAHKLVETNTGALATLAGAAILPPNAVVTPASSCGSVKSNVPVVPFLGEKLHKCEAEADTAATLSLMGSDTRLPLSVTSGDVGSAVSGMMLMMQRCQTHHSVTANASSGSYSEDFRSSTESQSQSTGGNTLSGSKLDDSSATIDDDVAGETKLKHCEQIGDVLMENCETTERNSSAEESNAVIQVAEGAENPAESIQGKSLIVNNLSGEDCNDTQQQFDAVSSHEARSATPTTTTVGVDSSMALTGTKPEQTRLMDVTPFSEEQVSLMPENSCCVERGTPSEAQETITDSTLVATEDVSTIVGPTSVADGQLSRKVEGDHEVSTTDDTVSPSDNVSKCKAQVQIDSPPTREKAKIETEERVSSNLDETHLSTSKGPRKPSRCSHRTGKTAHKTDVSKSKTSTKKNSSRKKKSSSAPSCPSFSLADYTKWMGTAAFDRPRRAVRKVERYDDSEFEKRKREWREMRRAAGARSCPSGDEHVDDEECHGIGSSDENHKESNSTVGSGPNGTFEHPAENKTRVNSTTPCRKLVKGDIVVVKAGSHANEKGRVIRILAGWHQVKLFEGGDICRKRAQELKLHDVQEVKECCTYEKDLHHLPGRKQDKTNQDAALDETPATERGSRILLRRKKDSATVPDQMDDQSLVGNDSISRREGSFTSGAATEVRQNSANLDNLTVIDMEQGSLATSPRGGALNRGDGLSSPLLVEKPLEESSPPSSVVCAKRGRGRSQKPLARSTHLCRSRGKSSSERQILHHQALVTDGESSEA